MAFGYPKTADLQQAASIKARWTNQDAANSVIQDIVGVNHLTKINSPGAITGYATSKLDYKKALQLVLASSQAVTITNANQVGLSGTFASGLTIMTLVRINSFTGSNQTLVGKYLSTGNLRSYMAQLQGSTHFMYMPLSSDGTALHETFGTTALSTGVWYRLWYVFRPGVAVELYVDEVSDVTNTTSVPSSLFNTSADFFLGARQTGATELADVDLQDIIIWGKDLTDSEITANGLLWTNPTAAQFNFVPDADTETSSVDGYTGRSVGNESFSTIRAGAGATAADSEATATVQIRAATSSNLYDILRRAQLVYDTTAAPSDITLTSAVLKLFGQDKNTGLGGSISITSLTTASDTAIGTGDHAVANYGSTSFFSALVSGLSTTAYNLCTLDANGIANFVKGGKTKYGVRTSFDVDNSSPTWSSGANTYFNFYTADNGTNKPQLQIEFTLPTDLPNKIIQIMQAVMRAAYY